jgi:hypothetical protein
MVLILKMTLIKGSSSQIQLITLKMKANNQMKAKKFLKTRGTLDKFCLIKKIRKASIFKSQKQIIIVQGKRKIKKIFILNNFTIKENFLIKLFYIYILNKLQNIKKIKLK